MPESLDFATPLLASRTADGYQRALAALVARTQEFLSTEHADSEPLTRYARALAAELRADGWQPRERMCRTDVHRNALKRLLEALDEFFDAQHLDGGMLGLRVWEAFEDQVKLAARSADSYGPNDTTWAPEDDTNPLKTIPVPVPDPDAEPINGFRQGDWVRPHNRPDELPRQILTGVKPNGFGGDCVRLSDPRDGTWFGGYFISVKDLGTRYVAADPPPDPSCKFCGQPHDTVPDDLCAPARSEYDRAGALGRELGLE